MGKPVWSDNPTAYAAWWARENRKKNPEKIRAYNNKWVMAKRVKWLAENGPCVKCGSWKRLEVDHKDPKKKITHNVWTWSEKRRNAELIKCQILCFYCHRIKTNEERGWNIHGYCYYKTTGCRCKICIFAYKRRKKREKHNEHRNTEKSKRPFNRRALRSR